MSVNDASPSRVNVVGHAAEDVALGYRRPRARRSIPAPATVVARSAAEGDSPASYGGRVTPVAWIPPVAGVDNTPWRACRRCRARSGMFRMVSVIAEGEKPPPSAAGRRLPSKRRHRTPRRRRLRDSRELTRRSRLRHPGHAGRARRPNMVALLQTPPPLIAAIGLAACSLATRYAAGFGDPNNGKVVTDPHGRRIVEADAPAWIVGCAALRSRRRAALVR